MIDELKEVGLTDNESKVYLALLDLGPSLAGGISRKIGMHRRTVYDTTEMLIKKGLIGYILKNNRRYFEASNPNRILEILNEKQDLIGPIVSGLMEKFKGSKEKQETNFYKGKEGLKTVFET
jgi:HTH-type transcriptional regulator, sugar sensing transcriptional regulator